MKVHDEVCGMTIDSETAAARLEFQGTVYYFCVKACKEKFQKNPGWYVNVKDAIEDDSGEA